MQQRVGSKIVPYKGLGLVGSYHSATLAGHRSRYEEEERKNRVTRSSHPTDLNSR